MLRARVLELEALLSENELSMVLVMCSAMADIQKKSAMCVCWMR